MHRLPRPVVGAAAGLAGAVALLGVGLALRPLLRAPTLPEVLAEWGTFYVPGELFAFMVNRFGAQSKIALFWSMVALVLLLGMAAGAAYARWPRPRVAIGLALGLWLFTLCVILPGAGLGFFGAEVYPAGPEAVTASYLIGWAAYAIVLAAGYWLATRNDPAQRAGTSSRGTPRAASSNTSIASKEVSQ